MSYSAYDRDIPLLLMHGLRTSDSGHEDWSDLGIVTLYPGETATTIKVEVSSMPAQFWRFTITDRVEGPDVVIKTGSGTFSEYWPAAVLVAGGCFDIKEAPAVTLDLNRIVTEEERAEIANDGLGTCWTDDEIDVADVIRSMAGIGYGGHFDECSDEEHAAHAAIARDDDELAAIHQARNEYTNLLREAIDAVEWPPKGDT